jgi:hypothetical protein
MLEEDYDALCRQKDLMLATRRFGTSAAGQWIRSARCGAEIFGDPRTRELVERLEHVGEPG